MIVILIGETRGNKLIFDGEEFVLWKSNAPDELPAGGGMFRPGCDRKRRQ